MKGIGMSALHPHRICRRTGGSGCFRKNGWRDEKMPSRSRKARQETVQKVECPLRTAAYCRLSDQDREMETMDAQIHLVQEFIRESPELELEETYVDNGVTGTNFHRPQWNRLMEDVLGARIECIVVKDLSRFGRNYLEIGYYLESLFPKLHVRFLAVEDNFDSSRPEDMADIIVPMKNMINAMYAKDTSRKMHVVRDSAMERGERLKNTPPLGYIYEDDSKEKLVIDEETAGIVRMIFHWASLGVGPTDIARRMEFLNIPSPRQWQRNRSNGDDMDPATPWYPGSINTILANRAYQGDTVTGMVRVNMYVPEKREEKDWYITEGTHQPIVSRELFEKVQGMKDDSKKAKQRSREDSSDAASEDSPLRGLVRCGNCGLSCPVGREKGAKLGMGYFFCRRQHPSRCTNRTRVPDQKLRMIIMDSLSGLIRLLAEQEKLMGGVSRDNPLTRKKRELRNLEDRKEMKREQYRDLYESYSCGSIDADEYRSLKESCLADIAKLDTQISAKAEETDVLEQKLARIRSFLTRSRGEGLTFNESMVRGMVKGVEIYDGGQISLQFRFGDAFTEPTRAARKGGTPG